MATSLSNSFPIDPQNIFNALNVGMIVVDRQEQVLLWNEWLVKHSQIDAENAIGKKLDQCFDEKISAAFLSAVRQTLNYGLPAVLSNALHRSPLPLYAPIGPTDQTHRIHQSIAMMPLMSETGERCCLIQITDSSTSIKREKMLRSHSDVLRKEATMDSLTGIYNRRFFDEHFKMAFAHCKRQKQPLAVFMIDVDCFKEYNDMYGHLAGDKALTLVAQSFRSELVRKTDIVARFGGEEFVLMMPGMSPESALKYAEKLRLKVWELAIPHLMSRVSNQVSVSIGVSALVPNLDIDARSLLKAADTALYRAKEDGRNQCFLLRIEDFAEEIATQ